MALYSGRILVRRGDEINYDPEKLMPGEWALSTDKKIVRICVSPGETIRMATYDAFEEDMEKIEEILATCQSIQEAVTRINTEISQKADAVAEYTVQAKQYRDEAKQYRDEAEQFSPEGYSKLLQTATETKERVDDLEENLETVSSDVETNKSDIEKVSFKVDTVIEKADLRIKETASGESIHLTDSADAKVVEFGLYGKAKQETTTGAQLLNYDAWKNVGTNGGTSVFENNGVTITATRNDAYTLYGDNEFSKDAKIPVNEGDAITLSWEETNNKNVSAYIFPNGKTSGSVSASNTAKSLTYTVPSGVTFVTFRFGVRTAGETISYKNIMINKGSTPLPYEPYTGGQPSPNPNYPQDVEISGASGNVVVKSCGKNLINQPDAEIEGGGYFIYGDFHIDGNAGGNKTYLPKGTYTLSFKVDMPSTGATSTSFYNKNLERVIAGSSAVNGYNKYVVTLEEDIYAIRGYANATMNISEIQIEKGSQGTEYEPYKGTSPTIPTPNGLAGIDVDSGGNYTDSNGQQRVCDVIVKYADGSGEYIKRVKEIVFDGTQKFTGAGSNFNDSLSFNHIVADKKANNEWTKIISNICPFIPSYVDYINEEKKGVGGIGTYITFKLDRSFLNNATGTNAENEELFNNFLASKYNEGKPVKALYQLNNPIRTPLTAEQIAEIEKLCTFYPETNIYNDAECGMKVTYIVDAKRYIDNKIAELATAMVNNI